MGQIFIITKTKKSVIKIRKYSTSICMTILSHMFIIHLKQSLDDLTSVINKYSEKTSLAFLSAKGLKNPTWLITIFGLIILHSLQKCVYMYERADREYYMHRYNSTNVTPGVYPIIVYDTIPSNRTIIVACGSASLSDIDEHLVNSSIQKQESHAKYITLGTVIICNELDKSKLMITEFP